MCLIQTILFLQSISNSWGGPLYGSYGYLERNSQSPGSNAALAAWDDMFMQAAIVGIGVYFSSGDSGDYEDGAITPEYPAASPWVTAVGATTLALGGGTNPYKYEVPWGWTTCNSNLGNCVYTGTGTGGGVANYYSTPFFQANRTQVQAVLQASGYSNGRLVPDVAADGDPYTGYDSSHLLNQYTLISLVFALAGLK